MKMVVGFPHSPQKVGGPGSFQLRIEKMLKEDGLSVVYPDDKIVPDVILVVAGTKKLFWLWKCKRSGARIVHRLDGLFAKKRTCKLKRILIPFLRNQNFRIIRNYLADAVIYQSQFVKEVWYKSFGPAKCEEHIIHNAVQIGKYQNQKNEFIENKKNSIGNIPRLICVEGGIPSEPAAIIPLKEMSNFLKKQGRISKTVVYGTIKESVKVDLETNDIEVKGSVPREDIPKILRNAVYFSLEINPACPNSVIEAMAAGCPIIGFDSGSLRELVPSEAGVIVDYDGDPWEFDIPNYEKLQNESLKLFDHYEHYSNCAKEYARTHYDINNTYQKYKKVLLKS